MTPTEWFAIYKTKRGWHEQRIKERESEQLGEKRNIKPITREKNLELGRRLQAEKYRERMRGARGHDA